MGQQHRSLASRVTTPSAQNFVAGIGIAFSAGVFVSLNLLGAGGGRPESSHIIQITNAILSSVWFFSACVGGTYLNLLGPGPTMCFGICTYALYVGSLWYYEVSGKPAFPLVSGAIIGLGSGAVFITSGYIQVAYSDERNKGSFIAVQNTLQAAGSIVTSIIPVILNRNNTLRSGVPQAVYISYITIMLGVALLTLLTMRRPDQLSNSDGTKLALTTSRDTMAALKANLRTLREWKLLIMIPAFLPAGSFLIYLGSVNAFQNNLRARCLLSFISLVVQIPCGHILHLILDCPKWSRRRRALSGLAFVGIPLSIAWICEIVRTRGFNRNTPLVAPLDWTDPAFAPILILFVLNWTASILWQYIVPWFIGALSVPPEQLSHYMGIQRGFLAAGEALCFGADSAKIPYMAFAIVIFALYAVGIIILAYLGAYHVTEPEAEKGSGEESVEEAQITTDKDWAYIQEREKGQAAVVHV
ncbi:hypothetical protein BX600DRAFT_550406 [Xylariales sp. PMI_506]|nr:hypothetical protein BX600DRAFT_550406 [Xylariales sp. PMI_506]